MIRLTITYIMLFFALSIQGQDTTEISIYDGELNLRDSKPQEILLELQDVYPNPFKSKINLKFQMNEDQTIRVFLFDIVGHLIHENIFEISPINNYVEINLEHISLENGMYLLRIEKGKDAETIRLVRK